MDNANSRSLAAAVAGLMAYHKLSVFSAQADNATTAPDLPSRLGLSNRSMVQMERVNALVALLREMGEDPIEVLSGFAPLMDAYNAEAVPADWWESLVKTYVGHGVASDVERELCAGLDQPYRDQLSPYLAKGASADYVASVVAAAVSADERWGHRLSLWCRRVVGEALSVTNQVFSAYPDLTTLLAEPASGDKVAALRGRLTQEHARRMTALGLTF